MHSLIIRIKSILSAITTGHGGDTLSADSIVHYYCLRRVKESSLDRNRARIRLLDAVYAITTKSIRVGVANLVPTFQRT